MNLLSAESAQGSCPCFNYCVNNSADNILKYFSWKIDFDISCKLSPKETTCMKLQSLFSEKK